MPADQRARCFIGTSNQDAALLSEALELSRNKGLPRYETIQNEFNLYSREAFVRAQCRTSA